MIESMGSPLSGEGNLPMKILKNSWGGKCFPNLTKATMDFIGRGERERGIPILKPMSLQIVMNMNIPSRVQLITHQ